MKIIQISKNNQNINLPSNAKIIHIGVEHWGSTPLSSAGYADNLFAGMNNVIINRNNFYINDVNILEFDELLETSFTLGDILDDYTFVTIAYETSEI